MLKNVLMICFVSMLPLIELRGGVPMAMAMGFEWYSAIILCAIANMLPVPVIYLFARKVLLWGMDKPHIGKFFTFCVKKGESGGRKLRQKAGRGGLFVALLLFVGIPIPGTGAWTGTLAASFLDMGLKSTTAAVSLGVMMAGVIMAVTSSGVLALLGF